MRSLNPMQGIFLKLLSVICFMGMQSFIKIASGDLPLGQVVFLRSVASAPLLIGWLYYEGRIRVALHTAHPFRHFARGTVGVLAMALNFAALRYLSLPDVTAIFYAAPIITVVLAAFFLGEKVGIYRISAVLIGLIGVVVILQPKLGLGFGGGELAALGAVCALGAAVSMGCAKVLVRKLVGTDSPSTVVCYASLCAIFWSLLSAPFGWVIPSNTALLYLFGAGLAGGMGQLLLTTAYRYAEASVIAPFDYSSMIFALLIGFFVFQEWPSLQTLVGAGLVIAAGLFILWREKQRR